MTGVSRVATNIILVGGVSLALSRETLILMHADNKGAEQLSQYDQHLFFNLESLAANLA